jgi:hypothetical protein
LLAFKNCILRFGLAEVSAKGVVAHDLLTFIVVIAILANVFEHHYYLVGFAWFTLLEL